MKQHRKSIRLPGYDYSTPGAYFITICTDFLRILFGNVTNTHMQLNALGTNAHNCWDEMPNHYPEVKLEVFQIMPNHMHGILIIGEPDIAEEKPRQVFKRHALGTILGSYKSAVTNQIHSLSGNEHTVVWEANYYEHIIRDDESLQRIREYIINNPLKWHLDRYNPERTGKDDVDDWLDVLDSQPDMV